MHHCFITYLFISTTYMSHIHYERGWMTRNSLISLPLASVGSSKWWQSLLPAIPALLAGPIGLMATQATKFNKTRFKFLCRFIILLVYIWYWDFFSFTEHAFDCQRQAFKLSELFIRFEDNQTTMPLYGLLSYSWACLMAHRGCCKTLMGWCDVNIILHYVWPLELYLNYVGLMLTKLLYNCWVLGRAQFKTWGIKKNSVPYMIEVVLTNILV